MSAQNARLLEAHSSNCVIHHDHCEACGAGFNAVDNELAPVYMQFPYAEDVSYPEISHMLCKRCDSQAQQLPKNLLQWNTENVQQELKKLRQDTSHATPCSSLVAEPHEKKQKHSTERYLIYGGKSGWLGNQLVDLCTEQGLEFMCSTVRIENRDKLEKELDLYQPTRVLMAAGITGRPTVDFCEDHKQDVIRTNVIGTLNVVDACYTRNIHVTNFATGCIFKYDESHIVGGQGFKEEDTPNFNGSFYSHTKGMVENLLQNYDNCLTLRIRMPISADLHHRNFVTKILNYAKVVNIPNSMTTLDDMLPIALRASKQKLTGILNFCNPGAISHNEILEMYREIIDPSFTWENFSEAECNAILKAQRSNNTLNATKLLALFPEVPEIHEACRRAFLKMAHTIVQMGRPALMQQGWKFPKQ